MRNSFFIFKILLIFEIRIINATDMQNTYFQIGEKLYPAIDAVKMKGGKIEGNEKSGYVMYKGVDPQATHLSSSDTRSIQVAFFPETTMVNFLFKKSMPNANIYINDTGPLGDKLDKSGNGYNSVYFKPRKKEQKIELSKNSKKINTTFSIIEDSTITCTGNKKLECALEK